MAALVLLAQIPVLAHAESCEDGAVQQVSRFASDYICHVRDFCEPSGRRRLWAQEVMATDLAQHRLRERGVPRVTTIAVVDSGFATEAMSAMARPANLHAEAFRPGDAVAISRDANPVRDRHGTRVVSMIKGIDGIGMSTDSPVHVYGLTRSQELIQAIDRACRAGAGVINVSWETPDDPLTRSVSRIAGSAIANAWERAGCVIVHAAGNQRQRENTSESVLLDNELEVAAGAPLTGRTAFSADGRVTAPGQSVIGLDGRAHRGVDSCANALGSFSDGTSFASPAVSAVTAMVRDTLLYNGPRRAPNELGRLAVQIVSQAEAFGVVNALLAVRMAEELNRSPSTSVEGLRAIVGRQAVASGVCAAPPAECASSSSDCAVMQKCLTGLREAVSVCPIQPTTETVRRRLFERLERIGDLEGASAVASTLAPTASPNRASAALTIESTRLAEALGPDGARLDRWIDYLGQREAREQRTIAPELRARLDAHARAQIEAGVRADGPDRDTAFAQAVGIASAQARWNRAAPSEFVAIVENPSVAPELRRVYLRSLAQPAVASYLSADQLDRVVRAGARSREPSDVFVLAQIVGRSGVPFARYQAAAREIAGAPGFSLEALSGLSERLVAESDPNRFQFARELVQLRGVTAEAAGLLEGRLLGSLPPRAYDAAGEADIELNPRESADVRRFLDFEALINRKFPRRLRLHEESVRSLSTLN